MLKLNRLYQVRYTKRPISSRNARELSSSARADGNHCVGSTPKGPGPSTTDLKIDRKRQNHETLQLEEALSAAHVKGTGDQQDAGTSWQQLAKAEGAGATGKQQARRLAGTVEIETVEESIGIFPLTHTSDTGGPDDDRH